jgi:hypothetical protein
LRSLPRAAGVARGCRARQCRAPLRTAAIASLAEADRS